MINDIASRIAVNEESLEARGLYRAFEIEIHRIWSTDAQLDDEDRVMNNKRIQRAMNMITKYYELTQNKDRALKMHQKLDEAMH